MKKAKEQGIIYNLAVKQTQNTALLRLYKCTHILGRKIQAA